MRHFIRQRPRHRPIKRTSFEFENGDGVTSADILRIDSRFVSLFKWLGENHIKVQLSGANTPDGYAVYRVREVALGRGTKLSAVYDGKALCKHHA